MGIPMKKLYFSYAIIVLTTCTQIFANEPECVGPSCPLKPRITLFNPENRNINPSRDNHFFISQIKNETNSPLLFLLEEPIVPTIPNDLPPLGAEYCPFDPRTYDYESVGTGSIPMKPLVMEQIAAHSTLDTSIDLDVKTKQITTTNINGVHSNVKTIELVQLCNTAKIINLKNPNNVVLISIYEIRRPQLDGGLERFVQVALSNILDINDNTQYLQRARWTHAYAAGNNYKINITFNKEDAAHNAVMLDKQDPEGTPSLSMINTIDVEMVKVQ